jgi:hypothetical protein
MIIYGVYQTEQSCDSDGWQHWTVDTLVKLFTEEHNAQTFIANLLIEEHDKLLEGSLEISTYEGERYANSSKLYLEDAKATLNNVGRFQQGGSDDIEEKCIYSIRFLEVEECPSISLNKE